MNKSLFFSFVCGLAPLLIGVSCYLLWLNNRSLIFEVIGFYNIFLGVFLFPLGLIFLCLFLYTSYKEERPKFLLKSLLSGMILFSNFPIASLILDSVSTKSGESTLTVENNTIHSVTAIRIITPSQEPIPLGTVSPNSTYTFTFVIETESETSASYEIEVGTIVQSGPIFSYVDAGMGGNAKIIVHSTDHITVAD